MIFLRSPGKFSHLLRAAFSLCTVLLLLTGAAGANGESNGEALQFAFFDLDGRQLLTLNASDPMFSISQPTIIFATNQILPARFSRTQQKISGSSGRHTAANFPNLAGHVLTVDGVGPANQSALIAPQSFVAARSLWNGTALAGAMVAADRHRIEADRERSVKASWGIFQGAGLRCYLVRFANRGEQALASLVFFHDNRILYRDFPAVSHPVSVWRADDGGRIGPEQFRILYLGLWQASLEIAFEFRGPEGSSLEFCRETDGTMRTIAEAFRYTAAR